MRGLELGEVVRGSPGSKMIPSPMKLQDFFSKQLSRGGCLEILVENLDVEKLVIHIGNDLPSLFSLLSLASSRI